jgi:hypothetical protein
MTDFTYKTQDVNYLGFLEAQLRDLQGIHTLAYELIQNADDSPSEDGRSPTTHLTFDITDAALLVSNNGLFREVDFARLQNIASGGKREESGTTGAFGLGFIAVYQVTDAPEIFSNGRHWRIQPQAPTDQRIQERPIETTGTLLRLPWAFDPASIVRRTLRLEAIQPTQLDDFARRIATAMEAAALFLKQLQVLEAKRNGTLVRRIERQLQEEQLILRNDQGETAVWLLLNGDFADAARQLRAQYPWQIEAKRHSQVQLALPTTRLTEPGRLFAGLPTDSTTPLSFHLNADFFPTTDRKRIHLDGGYQANWNQAAITCAAHVLANQFDTLPPRLGHVGLWHLLQKTADTHQAAQQNELPSIFTTFWQALTPGLSHKPIVYTASGEWRVASEVRLAGRNTAVSLLQALHIPTPHPDLLPYFPLLRHPAIAVPDLTIADIAAALAKLDLKSGISLPEAPYHWCHLAAWQELWQLIDSLLNYLPPRERETALQTLRPFPLVISEKMTLEPFSYSYRGRAEARTLFPAVAWAHEAINPDTFPGRYLPDFGVRQAVEWLGERPLDQLEQDWRLGWLDLPRLWRWFEAQQIEIGDDPSLAQAIRQLPLCLVKGELRPLAHLYLPGNFEDPLGLAGLIDVAALGSRRQFLRDLGAHELDFSTYVHEQLPRALKQNPDLPSDARHRLGQLLAERLGEMHDDDELRTKLSQLPLIPCLDGSFRPATQVYASREVMALLGETVHIAEPVESKAVVALYRWLGVREQPSAADIVQALLAISQKPLAAERQTVVAQAWQRLKELFDQDAITAETLMPLQGQPVIPNRRQVLRPPDQLFLVDRPELAAQFAPLDDYLLPETDWAALTTLLGVRPLSQALQLVLVDGETAVPDKTTQAHIANRRPLIERLLRAEGLSPPATFFNKLQVVQLPQPYVQYQVTAGTKTLTTPPEAVTVKLVGELLVLAEAVWTWTAVARELALAFKGDSPIGGLALGLKELLTAVTFAEARQILDDLGIGE